MGCLFRAIAKFASEDFWNLTIYEGKNKYHDASIRRSVILRNGNW